MDNNKIYIEMLITGWPTKCTIMQAISGKSQEWEEDKEAFLASEKFAFLHAADELGVEFLLDYATSSISHSAVVAADAIEPVNVTIEVPPVTGDVHLANPIIVGKPTEWEIKIDLHCVSTTQTYHQASGFVEAGVFERGYTPNQDKIQVALDDNNGAIGSLKNISKGRTIKGSSCSALCDIPVDVLNILVREDKKIALKCDLLRTTLACSHLADVQLPTMHRPAYGSRPRAIYLYAPLSVEDGMTMSHDAWKISVKQKMVSTRRSRQFVEPKIGRGRTLINDHVLAYLYSLNNPDIAARCLVYADKYERDIVGRANFLKLGLPSKKRFRVIPLRSGLSY